MAKWNDKVAYDMETERMKKAIQNIIDNSKNLQAHVEPWVDEGPCPSCLDNVCQCGPDDDEAPDEDETHECGFDGCDCWMDDVDETAYDTWHNVNVNYGYFPLFSVLTDALNEAQVGKGKERHGNDMSFTEQPALTITRAVGLGFPLGQAMKKIQESQRMDTDAAKRELLGAINYLAAAVLFLDE
jgi:hypothetical protein